MYNVGSGVARSFIDLASSISNSFGVDLNINWIDTPKNIRDQYQYFTKAKMDRLLKIGYNKDFYSLEKA